MFYPIIHLHVSPLKADSSYLMALNQNWMPFNQLKLFYAYFHGILRPFYFYFCNFINRKKEKLLTALKNGQLENSLVSIQVKYSYNNSWDFLVDL